MTLKTVVSSEIGPARLKTFLYTLKPCNMEGNAPSGTPYEYGDQYLRDVQSYLLPLVKLCGTNHQTGLE